MNHNLRRVLHPTLIAMLMAMPAATAGEVDLTDLQLRDCYGSVHKLADLTGERLTVVAFLGADCPLARLYGPRLEELAGQFRDKGVAFIGADSNVQDSLTEVLAYTQHGGIRFPMLLDTRHQLADRLAAERTPEVFVLDASGNVRYRGRVDDQYSISVARSKPTRTDLADAITLLLAGKAPESPRTTAVGCVIGRRPTATPGGTTTYTRHIAPILNRRCVECHREGEIAPFPLSTYEDTIGWGETIAEVVDEGRMPPWNANPDYGHFRNDARLSTEEKQAITTWVRDGCPEGDPSDLPTPPTFAKGWRIPEPDLVLNMDDKPFQVPATGVVDYKYFRVDPGFDKDMYVSAVEARPGNPEVVHHIVVYMLIPGERRRGLGSMLIGYAPGTAPLAYPVHAGMKIPRGTQFAFELHYTPNGRPATDLSYIGMKFIDQSEVQQEVIGGEALNRRFRIPAHAANHTVTAREKIAEDIRLTTLTPHMHLRGKAFRYEALYPDGRREILLDVPRYDFNWQLRYELEEPVLLPKGSVLECSATFDNSEKNLNNPDPGATVTWGEQSWEEMMIGFYSGIRPRQQQRQK